MVTLANQKAEVPALQAISVLVSGCSLKSKMFKAFASNFLLGHALPVEFSIIIDGRMRTAYATLYTIDSLESSSYLNVGGRLSLIGVEALFDRNNTVEFNASLALDSKGELLGTGSLAYFPPITSTRSKLP